MNSTKRQYHLVMAFAWLLSGACLAAFFSLAYLPPLNITIIVTMLIATFGLMMQRASALSLLPRLYLLLYIMPFMATIGYLFDSQYVFWESATAVGLGRDHKIINDMLIIGLVGLLGLLGGLEIGAFLTKSNSSVGPNAQKMENSRAQTLKAWQFIGLLAIAVSLSWLSAPSQNIFSASYGTSSSLAKQVNFDSAFLVSYLLIVLLYLDGERDHDYGSRKRWKILAVFATTLWIVVVLQLLRGDRESSGLIVALAILLVTRSSFSLNRFRVSFHQKRVFFRIAVALTIFIAAFVIIGSLRYKAVDDSSVTFEKCFEMALDGVRRNTWTSVGLNNLGLAAEYDAGSIEYYYGQTYLDYLRSLPPGILARMIGYVRPLERGNSPNWWYEGLSTGGMQPVIVPFKNFGIFGALWVLTLIGVFIAVCECKGVSGKFYSRLTYGSTAAAGFLWFWYGDMNIIRAIMITWLLSICYRIFVDSRRSQNISYPGPKLELLNSIQRGRTTSSARI